MPQGQVASVPDDGLTTRQRRNRPLLVVHTGEMKGKSTAAFHTDALKPKTWEYFWVLKCGDLGSGFKYSFRPAGTGSPDQPKEKWLFTRYLGEGRMSTYFSVIATGYKLIRQDDGSYAFGKLAHEPVPVRSKDWFKRDPVRSLRR
jgi:hypothetical protein